MNWKNSAIEDLKKYNALKASLINIAERIEALRFKQYGVKGAQTDKEAISGGGTHYEDFMIDIIVEQERLEKLLEVNQKLVELTERGLKFLDDKERFVLDKFYMNRHYGYVDELMEELAVEKTKIYNMKDDALKKFTCSMYGIQEF